MTCLAVRLRAWPQCTPPTDQQTASYREDQEFHRKKMVGQFNLVWREGGREGERYSRGVDEERKMCYIFWGP